MSALKEYFTHYLALLYLVIETRRDIVQNENKTRINVQGVGHFLLGNAKVVDQFVILLQSLLDLPFVLLK